VRRLILVVLLNLSLLAVAQASPDKVHSTIVFTDNLQKDAALSKRLNAPILLVVSQEHCPFCDLLKREVLNPMALSGDYRDKVVMREILIDLGESLINFEGKSEDAAEFAHRYDVYLTPTLLFLDPHGNELSKRIVDVNTVELFYFYLTSAIDSAREKMQ